MCHIFCDHYLEKKYDYLSHELSSHLFVCLFVYLFIYIYLFICHSLNVDVRDEIFCEMSFIVYFIVVSTDNEYH